MGRRENWTMCNNAGAPLGHAVEFERIQASTHVNTDDDYACTHCDFTGKGSVSAMATATMYSAGSGDEMSEAMTRDEADATAWQTALWAVECARCPKCGKRQPGAVSTVAKARLGRGIARGVFTFLFTFLVALMYFKGQHDKTAVLDAAIFAATLAILMCAGYVAIGVRRVLDSAAQVNFE